MNDESDQTELFDKSVPALATLRQETSPAFLQIVRAKIQRRTVTSHALSLIWRLPGEVVPALGQIFLFVCKSVSSRKE